MAHGLNTILKRGTNAMGCKSGDGKTGIGSRRIFAPQFKLQVLDSYRNDADCKGNQRATARKYGIHRRQIQKWLQVENNLRNSVVKSKCGGSASDLIVSPEARKCGLEMALRSAEHRQRDDVCVAGVESHSHSRQQQIVQQESDATGRGYAREEERRDAVDKRVPDIPQHQQTATTTTIIQNLQYNHHHYEWQQDDTSSSHSHSHNSHSEVEFYGIGSPSHCSLSPRSPPFVPIPLYPLAPLHIPTPVVVSPTPFCSSNMSPLPLDFTTHTRRVAPSPDSPHGATTTSLSPALPVIPQPPYDQQSDNSAAPIDLSLKKAYPHTPPNLQALQAPVPVQATLTLPTSRMTFNSPLASPTTNITTLNQTESESEPPQIWDLSTKGIKREHDTPTTRPVKLFKPYLDHIIEDSPSTPDDIKPIIVSSYIEDHYCTSNNNNNNIPDIKMEYPSFYKDEHYLQGNFYSPVNADYYPNGGLHYMDSRLSYEDARYRSIKQRQSYSLDFKLSAIECYYSDAICRGNQRAVATKFKIHRRQVQKWLKQEDQLRQRNDPTTTKPMHIIR